MPHTISICEALQALLSLSQVSKLMRMVTLPYVFSSVRIDLNEHDWATVAIASVHADTFKHVKKLELKIRFPRAAAETEELNADELHLQVSNSDAGHTFLESLPHLSILTIDFDINYVDDSGIQECLKGLAWSFLNILSQVPLRARNLKLRFLNTYRLAWGDDIWGELSQPFRQYSGASVKLDQCYPDKDDTPLGITMANTFVPTWISHLHLTIGRFPELRAAAHFDNLTHLTLRMNSFSDRLPDFWECLKSMKARLAFLSIGYLEPALLELALDTPVLLPSLTALEFTRSSSASIDHFCSQLQTPLLRSVNATFDLPSGPDIIERIFNLDRTLRNRSPACRYHIDFQGTHIIWQQVIRRLASHALEDPTFADAVSLSLSARNPYASGGINEVENEDLRANAQ